MLFSTLLVVAMTATVGRACSPENFPKGRGFEATMYEADVVLLGHVQDLNLNATDQNNDVTFSVDCVYKRGNNTNVIGSNVRIDGRYKFNSCTTTYLEQDARYLIALHNMDAERKTYEVFELNVASKAAYKEDKVDFEALVAMCGFQEAEDIAVNACTKSTVSADECSVPSGAANTGSTTATVLFLTAAVALLSVY